MTDLANRAGTTKPTLYARLGSKEQIYERVLEREADLLKASLYREYERAASKPLDQVVQIAMLAFFRFAEQRRSGFDLLFRTEPGGPGHRIGERAMDEVIDHYIIRSGHRPGARTPLLAAAGVGVARQVCQYALDNDHDLTTAGRLATAFADAGMRHFDETALRQLDIRRPARERSNAPKRPPRKEPRQRAVNPGR